MARDPRHDVLFEPVQIGPKTLRNRFWQVPHCNGAGSERPRTQAHFRGMKAEGGWAAVFTEMCTVSPDADLMPLLSAKIWDEDDVANLSTMCDAIHAQDSLAGVELLHTGGHANNFETRGPARGVSQLPSDFIPWTNTRAMTKSEIRQMRREHVEGALRARAAGFDLLTLFCALGSVPIQFFYKVNNKRTDEYGGSFENRLRFTRETLEEMREEIDDCAIGIRWSIDTMEEPYGYGDGGVRADGEGKEFIAALDDLVDYWDVNIGNLNWGEDAGPSRFFDTNHQAQYTRIAKEVSSKPVVNVGRFTDADVMVEAIESGQCDLIGAARPSIADPFLPKKIEEGRLDDIRECIGCNICVSKWEQGGPPITCTQNATSGEEFRRGWHPEIFSTAANADNDVLIVGAGPAGLECARVLARRGMRSVHLVDEGEEVGGHLNWVTRLPGFGEWGRVTNYRRIQLDKSKNVTTILGERLGVEEIAEYGAEYVVIATGAAWDREGWNGDNREKIDAGPEDLAKVISPEEIMTGARTAGGRVVVYDSDGYYMGVAIAEHLAREGAQVTYVAPSDTAAPYLRYTLEEQRQYERLIELGVEVVVQTSLDAYRDGTVSATQIWSGATWTAPADNLVMVCARRSRCEAYDTLLEDPDRREREGIKGLFLIGDAHTPSTIAEAVFGGHRLAREIDSPNPSVPLPYYRERYTVAPIVAGPTELAER